MVSNKEAGGGLLLMLALMLFVLPIQWIAAVVFAAAFHELCHYGAVRLFGGSVTNVHAGTIGARMEVCGLTVFGELVSALAGPLGSLLLLCTAQWLPRTAVCAGFQGIYNLLPVYPLDGGRVLRCGATLVLPASIGDKVCRVIEGLCLFALVLLGMYGTFFKSLGILPLALAISVVLRTVVAKIPCKPGAFSVQ